MSQTKQEKNKALVLEAFDTLFNKRDYVAAERYWSPNYIQHSAHIAPGRDGLFNLIKSIPPTLKYEPGTIVAEGDFVIVHGRFSGFGQPVNWIAADIIRIEDNVLVEHWDVIQDEATQEKSKSGRPMFGDASMAQTEEAAFPRLTSAELALVRPLAKPCDYADGDVVFRAGQPDIDLYVVESGQMEIRNPTDGRLIAVFEPGNFSGDIDMLTGRPVIAMAIARGPTRLLCVPNSHLR